MVVFSNCKINIGLYITGKRDDGYHNLETVFLPVPLFDVLELIDSDITGITICGQTIPGKPEDNIVYRAWQLLKHDFPDLRPVHFYLLKNIPVGSGLGAGSANGAYALLALNDKFQLGLTAPQLRSYALQLGSDCPFFVLNKTCFALGRGEIMEEITLDLSAYNIVIVNPGIAVSTRHAFGKVKPTFPEVPLMEALKQPVAQWKNYITNNFEAIVADHHPAIARIKQALYESGAAFALMSGSGSTVFGLFDKNIDPVLAFPENYFIRKISL